MKIINKYFLKKNIPKYVILYIPYFMMTVLLLTACSYKPSAHSIKKFFGNNIFIEVNVDRAEPENASYIKDEMNRIVYQHFKGHVVSKEAAESQIYIDYHGSTFEPLTYTNGYVTRYRVNMQVHFHMITPKGVLDKTISTIYESDIEESALRSSTLRIEAIKNGLKKAMDEFITYVSVKGVLNVKR
ncbi:MAG: hypothetical protein LGB68_01905 [Sulfurovum sp.]|nr:hypothetical protein [Sulfurovum sp.]MCB4745899.1 hypothetical protein [Sulfurovum sp.]MCB4748966.1 hypothetical protein [Sulfurovum sp.]MCB4754173.1 hypothetical protein [Sulfurovum sp.]MCB4763089.1 hypothetical protein [Sulfurovum sp.]